MARKLNVTRYILEGKVYSFRNIFRHRSTCCAIRVEIGCLIFAIFNFAAVATFFYECLYFILWLIDIQYVYEKYQNTNSDAYYLNVIYGVGLTLGAAICFVFAALLCYGVCKKKPGCLKAYLVFGVVVESLGLVSTLMFMVNNEGHDQEQRVAGVVALIVCGVYPLLLLLVARTYKLFFTAANGHHKLQSIHGLERLNLWH